MAKSGTPPQKRKKRVRKKKAEAAEAPSGMSTTKESARSGGGGVLQSMRSGFKRAAGAEDGPEEKPSTLSNVLWTVLLVAALGFLIYRWFLT